MVQRLPPGAVLVSHEKGFERFGLYNLLYTKQVSTEALNFAIIHLDHEDPWEGAALLAA
jgi:hypothetical protein